MSAPYKPFDFSTAEIHVTDLKKLERELGGSDAFRTSGRAAVTVARGPRMTAVLSVLKQGAEIHEHEAPGPVTLVVISGKVALRPEGPGGRETQLEAGSSAIFAADVRHSLIGLMDSAVLIVIGGR